jgi:hypothetical protein
MTLEYLNVNTEIVTHIVVPITGNGHCLFNSLSYLTYCTDQMAREVRKLIVIHHPRNTKLDGVFYHVSRQQ